MVRFAALSTIALLGCQRPSAPRAGPTSSGGPVVATVAPPLDAAEVGADTSNIDADTDTGARATFDADECREFDRAPALAIAEVTSRRSDCSSVGRVWTVFTVRRLERGRSITRAATSESLYGSARTQLAVGDVVLIALAPAEQRARTVSCVALPETQANVRRVKVFSSALDAERALAELSSGRACAHVPADAALDQGPQRL